MANTNITSIRHPEYWVDSESYLKWRLTYKGGINFTRAYLKKFSQRETDNDFADRKAISYCPAFAKAAVNDIKNAIFQRIADVTRVGGPVSYTEAVNGRMHGVDLSGTDMHGFIGRQVLPELLTMRKVGVFVDMPPLQDNPTLYDKGDKHPYLYMYKIEDICSWTANSTDLIDNQFSSILLRDLAYEYDGATGLPIGTVETFRHLYFNEQGTVNVDIYDTKGEPILTKVLDIKILPFVIFEITSSLLEDAADIQIALLNIASSDVSFITKANCGFYVEQFDPHSLNNLGGQIHGDESGTAGDANSAGDLEVQVGTAQGRQYAKGLNSPAFIHPSSEPLMGSMAKQEKMKAEIRLLVNLAVVNMDPKMASADSKSYDERSLEAGLSYIGLVLQHGERQVARIWAAYEGSKEIPTVNYPTQYNLKSDDDRRKDASELLTIMLALPSRTAQREIAKKVVTLLIGNTVTQDVINSIHMELDKSKSLTTDINTLVQAVTLGGLSLDLFAELLGFPPGEPEKAAKDHAERLARVQEAQSPMGIGPANAQARGVPDLGADPLAGKKEKAASRDTTTDPTPTDKTRGAGK